MGGEGEGGWVSGRRKSGLEGGGVGGWVSQEEGWVGWKGEGGQRLEGRGEDEGW